LFKQAWGRRAGVTDAEIVRAVLAGRQDLFAVLVDKYQGLIFAAVRSSIGGGSDDADDLAQEVFLKAYRALPQFRGDASFSTWLYRIALNHLKDRVRSRWRSGAGFGSTGSHSLADPEETPEEAVLSAEYRAAIQRCLAELPEIYRQAVFFHHYHGLSYAEIGKRLGIPARTVETRLYRAKRLLREKLVTQGVPERCATR